MPATWIIESKLVEPAPPPGWARAPLLAPDEALPAVTLLVAGPGYGKTRALAALAGRQAERGAIVAWYALDAYDADQANFFHYVVAAFRRKLPDFGDDVVALLGSGEVDPRLVWHRIFRALAEYNVEAVLALDDAQHLLDGAPDVLKALFASLEGMPHGMHVVIASRRKLPFPLARHQAAGRVRPIGPERLRFDEAEREAFLAARAPGGEVPAAWSARAAALDGWPLGLELLTHGVDAAADEGDGDAVAEYVAEELFQVQPEPRRQFMLQAAILSELSAETCREAFGRTDAAAHLEALEADMLVERLAGGAGLRFPTFLETFLRAEAERSVPAPVFASWHRGAAAMQLDRGRPELALTHLAAIGDWPALLNAGMTCFPAMLATGRFAPIERCLAAIPASVAAEQPAVPLWRGYLVARKGQHTDAVVWFERALEGFRAKEDRAGELKAIVRLAGIALLAREMPKFGRLAMQALALLEHGRPEDRADLNLMRALAAEQRGDMGLMRECNEAVLAIPIDEDVEVATCRYIALLNLFTAAWHGGDLALARARIEEAAEVAEAWRFRPYFIYAAFMRAQLCLTEGDVAGAGACIRALPDGWAEMFDWHDRACAYTIQGEWLAAAGDDRAGEELLRKAMGIFTKAEFHEGVKAPLERLMWVALRRRQPGRARELLRELSNPGETNIYDHTIALAHGRALHLDGDAEAAAGVWDQLVPALKDIDARLHVARARLYEAATRLKLGDRPAAEVAYKEAEGAIERYGFAFLRETDRGLWEELRPLAEPTPVPAAAPMAAATVATAVVEAPPAPTPAPRRRGTGPLSLDPAAAPVVAAGGAGGAAAAAPPPPAAPPGGGPGVLEMRLFGAFEVFQGGVRVDQWPRKKARLVLAALALYPRGLTAEQLAEAVGEDTSTPAFLASVRVNVMTLRKLLEPEMGKREGSRYVLFESEKYMLAPDMVASLDWRVFEEAVAEGDRAKDKDANAAAGHYRRAMGIYRANLLEDGSLAQSFEAERETFRRKAIDTLLWLADHDGRRGDAAGEGATLLRATAIAPCEEEIYVRLMRHHLASGRPERVRQAYWDCRKALKARLGIAPSELLEKAYKELGGAV